MGKNEPQWEKINPDGKKYLPAVRILSEKRICQLPRAKRESKNMRAVHKLPRAKREAENEKLVHEIGPAKS